jgi:hypothetical protein
MFQRIAPNSAARGLLSHAGIEECQGALEKRPEKTREGASPAGSLDRTAHARGPHSLARSGGIAARMVQALDDQLETRMLAPERAADSRAPDPVLDGAGREAYFAVVPARRRRRAQGEKTPPTANSVLSPAVEETPSAPPSNSWMGPASCQIARRPPVTAEVP